MADARSLYAYHRVGSGTDVTRATRTGIVLMGGSKDVGGAFEWLCELSRGGDFLVVRSEGTDRYNPYVARLCPQGNSVATLIVPDRRAAHHPRVATIIRQAEALWIASGDQSDYLSRWTGTRMQKALRAGIKRGIPVGGTSAGLNVLTRFIYPAEGPRGATSEQALTDPFHPSITIRRDFVSIPVLARVLGDSHFRARDRMGRDLALLCRIAGEGWAARPRAIAVDEDTALLVDEKGRAVVVGAGSVYFLEAPGAPEICVPRTPLTYRNIEVYRLGPAGEFDLPGWRGQGGAAYQISAERGTLTSTQAGGGVY